MIVNQEQRHHNTVTKWGGRIITLTYKFVLDAWQTRNDIEHGMDRDPIQTKKDKLIRQIIWKRNKLVHVPNNYLRNLNEEQLHNLPIDNLEVTAAQLQVLMKANPNGNPIAE
jgi:hypothetical protein